MPKYIVWHTSGAISLEKANFWFGPIVVVSGLSATLAGGWLGDRLRSRWPGAYFLVSGAAMVAGFPLFLLLTVTPFPAAWILIFVACFCVFFCTGPTNTIIANVTHPSIRAAAFALNILIIHALGDVISPPLIGWINDSFGGNMNAGFVAVSFMILVSGLCWLCGARYLERDTQRAITSVDD
jgi:MFS family permease